MSMCVQHSIIMPLRRYVSSSHSLRLNMVSRLLYNILRRILTRAISPSRMKHSKMRVAIGNGT
jgi:hypothetical protein